MKKYILIFLIVPLFTFSQWSNPNAPNKLTFVDFLNPTEKNFSLDTSSIGSTTLQYQSFSTKGQMIDVMHTQSLTEYLDFNFNLKKFSQEGVFNRESLKLYDVNSNLNFHNKKETYKFDAILSYSKIRMDENGGVIDYTIENFDDPLLYQTNLVSAENYSKNRFHLISQNFNFADKWSLINEFSILKSHRIYTDNDLSTAFYQNILMDSLLTNDSLSTSLIKNSLGLKYANFGFAYILHKRQNFIHSIDSSDIDNGVLLSYKNYDRKEKADFRFFESSQYMISVSKTIQNDKFQHFINADAQRVKTPIFYNAFHSNHFVFNNNFLQESRQSLNYRLSYNKLSFNSSIKNYNDYIYLNEDASYIQSISSILHVNNLVSFDWKWFNFYGTNSIQYQWSNNEDILRYPDINTSLSIWYQDAFFERALDFRIGAKINYFTPYYAKFYNPALASFQLQNTQEVGGLPYISSFINFKVHSMNINIQLLNLNELLSNSPHYFMPNYPSQPTSIKFALIWELSH